MFEIPESVAESPRRMTQAVLQAADLLGLYNAELARILGLMCDDIGRIASARDTLQPDTEAWRAGNAVSAYLPRLVRIDERQ